MSETALQSLMALLWPQGDRLDAPQVHMLLDGARDPEISQFVRRGNLKHECLFAGQLSERLQAAAPYLVHLEPASPLTRVLLERSWNQSWGIFTIAPHYVTISHQRIHFKKLLRVRDEDGNEMAFRFYDPRVLGVFLPTCTGEQVAQIFGPVQALIAQSDLAGTVVRYVADESGMIVGRTHCLDHVSS